MRAAIPALLIGLLGVVLVRATVPPMVPPQPPGQIGPEIAPAPHERRDPSRDLKVVAEADGKEIVAGSAPYLKLTLVNTSKAIAYTVVKPGDGSECGWRDPYVHLTAEQLSVEGKWVPIAQRGIGRCGLFDHDWPKDVIELKPGEKLPLNSWGPVANFNLQHPGKIRVFAHYEYRATGGKDGRSRPVAERGKMGESPLFAIASEPIEFNVVRPLDLQVKLKQPLKVGVEKKISEVIQVTVTNTTDKAMLIVASGPTGAKLAFCGGGPEANNPELTEYAEKFGSQVELKPGQTASLVGAGELAIGADGRWTGRMVGKYKVRAVYVTDAATGTTVEAWIEVPVEK